jgi:hypothetical protein
MSTETRGRDLARWFKVVSTLILLASVAVCLVSFKHGVLVFGAGILGFAIGRLLE